MPTRKEINNTFLEVAMSLDSDHTLPAWDTFPYSDIGNAAWDIFDKATMPSEGSRKGAPAVLACLFLSHMHHEL
jgi:hypothetical protein